jgi:transcription antitermination factor NusG
MSSLIQDRFTGLDQTSLELKADLHWYALRTNAHHEKRVRDRLAGIWIEPFLPLTREQRQWSDRKVFTELPLFTGYCFARFSLKNRLTVMQISGVAGIVGSVGPEAIPEAELDAIRSICVSDRLVKRVDHLIEGMRVEVISGPLRGMQGQFMRQAGHGYIVLRIHLIQQAVAVHIHMDEVAPLHQRRGTPLTGDLATPNGSRTTACLNLV